MSNKTITTAVSLEIVPDDQKELLEVVAQNGLQPETAKNLQSSFAPLFTQARSVLEKSRAIAVTDVSQKLEIKLARTYRLELRAIRVASDKTRKELKEESHKKGKAIDGFHNILLHLVEAEENHLDEQEKFAERMEAERKAKIKAEREELLKPYGVDSALFQLAEMSQDTFDQLLSGTKLAHEAKAEAARKAEAERIAHEAAELAERECMRAENERLRKEAEEKEAALRVERERVAKEQAEAAEKARIERAELQRKADEAAAIQLQELRAIEAKAAEEKRVAEQKAAKERAEIEAKAAFERAAAELAVKKEREAREKLEAEKRRAEEDESARVAAESARAKKAESAPDKEKLLAFAAALDAVRPPSLGATENAAVAAKIVEQHGKFVKWVIEKANAL